jgi:hypothetical protein
MSEGVGGRRPRVVLLTGEPGSGKTGLGLELARALHVPFLARDQVRRGMYLTAGVAPSADEAVEVFLRLVEALVGNDVSCVVEYVVRAARPEHLERLTGIADCVVIETWCSDAPSRRRQRDLADPLLAGRPDAAEAEVARAERMARVTEAMQRTFDLPTLRVGTDDGYVPPLEAIVDFARDRRR